MQIEIVLDDGAIMPTKAHEYDAGFDLYTKEKTVFIRESIIDTGVHIAIPKGFMGQIVPRSSMSKRGFEVATGTIDSGYTGSIKINIRDRKNNLTEFQRGERIAQLVIVPIPQIELKQVESLPETERGDGGFGSTGK